MWEFTSGIPPFNGKAHDFHLALSICKGKRPEIIENTPQYYIDLMKKCWDENPLKRPNSFDIKNIIEDWIKNITDYNITNEKLESNVCNCIKEFYEADKALEQNQNIILIGESHSQAYHTSRLLDFTKKLNEALNQEDLEIYGYDNNQSNKLFETEISQNIGNCFNKYKKIQY
jgi:hypothetical protein